LRKQQFCLDRMACGGEHSWSKRRRVYRSAPSIGDLSAIVGTREQVLACLAIQAQVRTRQQQHSKQQLPVEDEDECAVCCSLLCEPVRWPAQSGCACEHRFCKSCVATWMKSATQPAQPPTCPLCRAPAVARLSRGSITIDHAIAARVAQRHPRAYAERLALHRQESTRLREQQQAERTAMPVVLEFPEVQQRSANYYWGFFWLQRTDHLNALAHALASPKKQMLVLSDEERGRGARGRVVSVRWSGMRAAGSSASSILQALVARRARWDSVCVELRAERRCALIAPAYADEERLGVIMGEVRAARA